MLKNKGLIQEYLKGVFFADKDKVINHYLLNKENFIGCKYTGGAVVIIDLDNNKAYTRNGFLFSVILQDEDYLQAIGNAVDVVEELNKKYETNYTNSAVEETEEDENGDE